VTVYASISSFDMSELIQNLYFNDLVALLTYAYFSKPSPITGISMLKERRRIGGKGGGPKLLPSY
jgi:hypothetical protein